MLKRCFTERFRLFAISNHHNTAQKQPATSCRRGSHPRPGGGRRAERRAGYGEKRMSVSMTMPILIVDDYNTMIRILRNLLRQLGFSHIDEACDARTALAKMQSKRYGLVISDAHMAPMSGVELLQRVRADERTRDTPFVMIAGDADEGADAERRAGASSYIVSPFTAQALKAKLEPVIGVF
jgi:two-component system chemotaxis response regulator CheY